MIEFDNIKFRSRRKKEYKRRHLQETRHIQYKLNTSEIKIGDKLNVIVDLFRKEDPHTTDAAVLKMMINTCYDLRDFFMWINKEDYFNKLNREFSDKNTLCKTKYHGEVFKISDLIKIKRPLSFNLPNNLISDYLNSDPLDAAKATGSEFNKSMVLFYSLAVGINQLEKDFITFNKVNNIPRDNNLENKSV